MVIHDAGTSNINDGDQLDDGYFQGMFRLRGAIYEGTGFNSSQSGTGTDTQNHTITLTAAELKGCTILFVVINGNSDATANAASGVAYNDILIERDEASAGSFETVKGFNLSYADCANDGEQGHCRTGGCLAFVPITLTAGELANGLDIKITTTSVCGTAGDTATITNSATFFLGVG